MGVRIRLVSAGMVLLLNGRVDAQETNPLDAVRADRWMEARTAAARFADPVAEKLVDYLRLRAPGAATVQEIAAFMRRNPDWPAQPMLERRRQEAIVSEPDDAAVLSQCDPVPGLSSAMLRCARAIANAGQTPEANVLARLAWVGAIDTVADEAEFLHRWGGIATSDDQWARFRRLASKDDGGAGRQISRVSATYHAAAEAWLAAKRDDPETEALVAVLPGYLKTDPGLILDRVRAFRRSGHAGDAAVLLGKSADADKAAVFWTERNLLARALLRDSDARTAYAVVAAHGQLGDEQRAEAEFLAGFIALRLLHDPAKAEPHFRALAGSRAVITQARAHYWLARTAAAAGADAERQPDGHEENRAEGEHDARAEYEQAAVWPTTFYGQLAVLALGETPIDRIRKLSDPAWTKENALAFTGHEVFRAAVWLIAWGDRQRVRGFLTHMDELAALPAERVLTAAFARGAGLPDAAVSVARRMGRDGTALPGLGWPTPYNLAPPPDTAFSLGIMRQESSFDVGAISSSGARGLMQLMPPTAAAVAKELGIAASIAALTSDASHNIRLGTAYLQDMLTHFDNCLPLAAAAYNAGPRRVAQWLVSNGDPRIGPIDMVDWVELIPVGETRNYVQRVMENVVIYRAESGDSTPILAITPWTR